MKKTLALTALSLALLGGIGTKSAHAMTISKALELKHNMILSKHKIDWYRRKGKWTLHSSFPTCKAVRRKLSERQAEICYHARVTLERHTERYNHIHALLYPAPAYSVGPYNWNDMVHNCEARNSGWYANTGNGFYFGLQFTPSTWHANGGPPVLEMDGHGAPMRSLSIDYIEHIGYNVMKSQGPGAWPNCNGYLYGS